MFLVYIIDKFVLQNLKDESYIDDVSSESIDARVRTRDGAFLSALAIVRAHHHA